MSSADHPGRGRANGATAAASAPAQRRRPRIAVIGTGGTFAMHARHRFDWVEYAESGVVHPIDDLLRTLGDIAPDVELLPLSFRSLGSVSIGPDDWLALARLIHQNAARDPGIDGFVVTHGTATLEETAWFLSLALSLDAPVVLTGAQRPANTAGSDVAANLRAAVAVASAPASRGAGVLVVMDGLVFDARDVSKASSFELNAFEAPPFGPLARVDADAQVVWRRHALTDARRAAALAAPGLLAAETQVDWPRVDIVLSYAGADRVVIDALVAAGTRAIVCAGLAPGRPASGEFGAYVDAVHAGVVVVQATRVPRGSVPVQRFLQAAGILAGGDLSPQKLRIALLLALRRSADAAALQDLLLSL
ncbi:asparaginase [Chitinasiproducens palmae]|uniref:L-asparaginase n=1 Tax=Chitinasiproducens palmae TaxID=1770053 RepID=A0A1H2PLN1_9BURK|nr:asparaginase [Chitinasiproducens palmae]SDV47291.1 L-asparaginase [Chitinasiproducens palmae]